MIVPTQIQKDTPKQYFSCVTAMLKALRVRPTKQVDIVTICRKLSFFYKIVPDLAIKQNILIKSNICKQPAMTKIEKQR